MADATIIHRLDLTLSLIDTTTGKAIRSDRILIQDSNGATLSAIQKQDGIFLFLGIGREDRTLHIEAQGYEPTDLVIEYQRLSPQYPLVVEQLIPTLRHYRPLPCKQVSGNWPGIRSITAVRLGERFCIAREWEERRRKLTLYNPHRKDFENLHYALLDLDTARFEEFVVTEQLDSNTVRVDHPFAIKVRNDLPICPVVFGRASPDGEYVIRFREPADQEQWMLHISTGTEEYFETIYPARQHTLSPPIQGKGGM